MTTNTVTENVFKMLEVLLFCSDENDFPEYCYSGEFSISQEDVDKFDVESLFKLQKAGVEFANEVGEDLIERYDHITGRNVFADAVYTGLGTGITFEGKEVSIEMWKALREAAHKHLGWLEFACPYKGDDGKIYLS